VELPNQLVTLFEYELDFQQETAGTVEIIAEDLRLIERLLYQFRDLTRRNNLSIISPEP